MRVMATGLMVAFVVGLSGQASAEERLKDYIYNPDGTYHEKSLTERTALRGSGFIESSAGALYDMPTGDIGTVYGLRGSYARNLSTNIHLQTDLNYEYFTYSSGSIDRLGGTLHIATRFPNEFALGAFGQFGLIGASGANQHSFGFEGVAYSGDTSYFGRVGYGSATISGVTDDAFFGGIGARRYFDENKALEAEGRFTTGYGLARVTGLYRLPDSNYTLSLTARYDASLDQNVTEGVASAIARWRYSFGSGSLKQEEREGAIWNPIN